MTKQVNYKSNIITNIKTNLFSMIQILFYTGADLLNVLCSSKRVIILVLMIAMKFNFSNQLPEINAKITVRITSIAQML